MDIDDGLSLGQAAAQLRVLAFELKQACLPGYGRLGFPPPLARRQRLERAGLALAAPIGQMRGVQAFTTQQRPKFTGRAVIGLLEDLELVLGAEAPAFRPRHRFGVGCGCGAGRADSGPGLQSWVMLLRALQ